MKQSYEHCDLLCLLLDTIINVYENILTFFSKGNKGAKPYILGRDDRVKSPVHIVLNYIFLLHSPQPE